MLPPWMNTGPCSFLKVGGTGIGAFGTSDLVPFSEGVSACGRSWKLSEGITHSFLVTITGGQNFVLGPSISVCFSGEFVWSSKKWVRELISERWKNFTNPVDAAFRRGHNSVFLIKVLLG